MRYYCKSCGSEWKIGDVDYNQSGGCPFCRLLQDFKIPDYETPEQYKIRTGKEWKGATYYKHKDGKEWNVNNWGVGSVLGKDYFILCAQSPNPPPDDWQGGSIL